MQQLPEVGCCTQWNHMIEFEQGNICRLLHSAPNYSKLFDQLHKTCLECSFNYWPNVRFRPLLHSLTVVTPEWLTLRHSSIIATNSLPLWNPVLRKVVLSMPWRHNGGGKVQLHSFITLPTKWRRVVNSMPWPLNPQGRIPVPFEYRAGWSYSLSEHFREEKNHMSLLGSTAACSIVTIPHSFTQTTQWKKASNQHTLQSPVHIICCT